MASQSWLYVSWFGSGPPAKLALQKKSKAEVRSQHLIAPRLVRQHNSTPGSQSSREFRLSGAGGKLWTTPASEVEPLHAGGNKEM